MSERRFLRPSWGQRHIGNRLAPLFQRAGDDPADAAHPAQHDRAAAWTPPSPGARYVAALSETREAWRRAYCGEPPTRAEHAAGELVAWLLDAGEDVGVGA
jgi:hypothetical protein